MNLSLCQLGIYPLQVTENSWLLGFKQMTVYFSKITTAGRQLLEVVQQVSIVMTAQGSYFFYNSRKFYSWLEMFHLKFIFEAERREI